MLYASCTKINGKETICCSYYRKNEAMPFMDRRAKCRALHLPDETKICLNGLVVVGSYCGRGPCSMNGCDCEGGCLDSSDDTGPWDKMVDLPGMDRYC